MGKTDVTRADSKAFFLQNNSRAFEVDIESNFHNSDVVVIFLACIYMRSILIYMTPYITGNDLFICVQF